MCLPAKSCVCPCGERIEIPIVKSPYNNTPTGFEYEIEVECPSCSRVATGGNYLTGEVTSWMTRQQIDASQMEYERQLFEAENNEFFGRGNW